MKKILIGVIYCILLNLTSNAQSDVPERAIPIGSPGGAVRVPGRLYIGEQVYLPIGTDLPGDSSMTRPGSLYNKKPLSSPYSDLYYWNGQTWVLLISGSTGTLEETDPVAVNKRITINGTTQILDSNPVFNIPPPDLTNYATTSQLALKVNISDTANMLFPYQRKGNYVVTETDPVALPLIGTLSNLTTTAKSNLVSSINEVNGKILTSLTLNGPTALFTSPTTFTGSNGVWTGTSALNTQAPNTFFAGPGSGANATPTFRLMTAADIAAGSGNYIQNQFASAQSANLWISGQAKFQSDVTVYSSGSSGNIYIGNAFSGGTILTLTGSTSGASLTSVGTFAFNISGIGTPPLRVWNGSGDVGLSMTSDIGYRLAVNGAIATQTLYGFPAPATINGAGTALVIGGGIGVGTGQGGNIQFTTTPAGTVSGTTANTPLTRMTIDAATGTTTLSGVPLVLGNMATDPAGSNGMMEYNTTSGQFKGYRAGAWNNFLMTNDITANNGVQMSGTTVQTGGSLTANTFVGITAWNTKRMEWGDGARYSFKIGGTNLKVADFSGGYTNFDVVSNNPASTATTAITVKSSSGFFYGYSQGAILVDASNGAGGVYAGQGSNTLFKGNLISNDNYADATQGQRGVDITVNSGRQGIINNYPIYGYYANVSSASGIIPYAFYAANGYGYIRQGLSVGAGVPTYNTGVSITSALSTGVNNDVLVALDINPTFSSSATGISALGTITGGSGYTVGTFTGVGLLGGSGSGAIATVVIGTGGVVSSVTLTNGGSGYTVGNTLSLPGALGASGTGFSVPVSTLGYNASHNYSLRTTSEVSHKFLPTYADDTSAGSGGLLQGDLYITSTGQLMVKL